MARLDERQAELRREFDLHLVEANQRSDRIHELSAAVGLLVEAQKLARRAEESQYRRLEIRFQWVAAAVGIAGLVISVTLVILAIHFH